MYSLRVKKQTTHHKIELCNNKMTYTCTLFVLMKRKENTVRVKLPADRKGTTQITTHIRKETGCLKRGFPFFTVL